MGEEARQTRVLLWIAVGSGNGNQEDGQCLVPCAGQKAATAGDILSQYLDEMYFLYFFSEAGEQDQTWVIFSLFLPKLPVQGREGGADCSC